MSDATRDAFGPLLLQLQAEMREMRAEMRDLRADQNGLRAYIGARAAETEALVERLFAALNARLDQTERSVEERLTRLEAGPP